jgi:hypothetical protein
MGGLISSKFAAPATQPRRNQSLRRCSGGCTRRSHCCHGVSCPLLMRNGAQHEARFIRKCGGMRSWRHAHRHQPSSDSEVFLEMRLTMSLAHPSECSTIYVCPQCGVDGVFGYRNKDGDLIWYCADHRLGRFWADVRRDVVEPTPPASSGQPDQQHPPSLERFEHYCWCGKWGSFGYGVNLQLVLPTASAGAGKMTRSSQQRHRAVVARHSDLSNVKPAALRDR